MPHVQRAILETKSAYMSGDFAVGYATRLFGEEAVAKLPRISRGKRKGAIKGMLSWTKCTVGGWLSNNGMGGVCYPGFVDAQIEIDGKIVLETQYPTYEKKLARESEERAAQLSYKMTYLAELEDKLSAYEMLISSQELAGFEDVRAIIASDIRKVTEARDALRAEIIALQ